MVVIKTLVNITQIYSYLGLIAIITNTFSGYKNKYFHFV